MSMASYCRFRDARSKAYLETSRRAGKVWKEHGALEYRECVGDDLNIKNMTGFPKVVKIKAGETVVFSWIVLTSRAPTATLSTRR